MDAVRNLEKTLAGMYKDLPHLPVGLRVWLGQNVWWLVIISVVVSVFAVFTTVGLLLALLGISSVGLGIAGYYGNYAVGGILGVAWLGALLAVISFVAIAILLGIAVNPLKAGAKKGWNLLFLVALVSLVSNVVGSLMVLNIGSVAWDIITAAISAYFLFEIRDQFGKKVAAKHPAGAPAAKK